MIDVLFRYATEAEFFAAMTTLGIRVSEEAEHEAQVGDCSTPDTVTDQGILRMVRFYDDAQLADLASVLTATLLVDWRSDVGGDLPNSYTLDASPVGAPMIAFARED